MKIGTEPATLCVWSDGEEADHRRGRRITHQTTAGLCGEPESDDSRGCVLGHDPTL
nr:MULTISPECIES: hypothetical protein [Cryobacterium]